MFLVDVWKFKTRPRGVKIVSVCMQSVKNVCAEKTEMRKTYLLSCFLLPSFLAYLLTLLTYSCWQRGSMVRTSVFGWRTFPDLRLIYGWHMTTSWVRCPLWVSQPSQLSLSSIQGRYMSSNLCNYHVSHHVITRITGVETNKRQTRAAYGCLVVRPSSWARA